MSTVKHRDGRILFKGPQEAAEEWVANNFPRPHFTGFEDPDAPTVPEVTIESDDKNSPVPDEDVL
jgi:hypothetical protein